MTPSPASTLAAQGPDVVLAQRPQAGLGVDLRGREVQVAEELPHLVDRYQAGIEQDRGDGMAQEMGVDPLGDARRPGTPLDQGLYRPHGGLPPGNWST
jgi:hypothetical protein